MTGIWVIWREWTLEKNPGAAYRDPGVAESRPGVTGVPPLVDLYLTTSLVRSPNVYFQMPKMASRARALVCAGWARFCV